MRKNYTPFIYIFVAILVIAMLGLLFLRQNFVEFLRGQTGAASIEVVVRKSVPANELINTEILESETLISLKDNIKVFTFEETCGESINAPKRCVKGNSNPFFNKKEDKTVK